MLNSEIKSNVYNILNLHVNDFGGFNLDTYEANKRQFFEDFGGKLIVSKEVDIQPSTKFKEDRMKYYARYELSSQISDLIIENGVEGFYANKIMRDLEFDDGKIKIKAGMKLSKAFKFFLTSDHMLERNQTKYSQVFNTTQLKGNLAISIHPLDYLSMSQNKHNWSSCQSLDGDYAAGTLGLMNDGTTLVAYLENGEQYDVFERSDVQWNSKKWRTLIHINADRDLVLFSKGYPFESVDLMKELLSILKEIYPDSKFMELEDTTTTILSRFFDKHYNSPHYSDLRSSRNAMNFDTYMSIGEGFNEKNSRPIVAGHEVDCCKCGKDIIEEPYEYCCYSCAENRYCCDSCGDTGFHEDDMYNVDSEMICSGCLDEYYSACENCDEMTYNDNMYTLEETDGYYCECCYNEIKLEFEEEEEPEEE